MLKRMLVISIALLVSACSPAAPSAVDTSHDYKPPVFAPGTCILGTTPDCVTVIPLPKPATPEPVKLAMTAEMSCAQDSTKLVVTCRFTARNEKGQVWTSHITRQVFDWGDGTPEDHNDGFAMTHTYTSRGSFGIGGFVFDDRDVSTYVNGSINTTAPSP